MSKLVPNWQRANILEAVFDQLSDGLMLYDKDLLITGVNKSAERLFGMAAEDMIGKSCKSVFQCTVCAAGCGVLVGLNQSPNVPNTTIRIHTDNGLERLALMRTTQLFDANGKLEGVVATIKDITDEIAPQKRTIVAESSAMRELMAFVETSNRGVVI